MDATGIIFAALDCDADAIEAWNRWYDLEHIPPNVALDGIMYGNRYVAPAALHELRLPGSEAFTEGRSTFLTVYTLTSDVAGVFADMTEYRERLVDADRMFPDEKKAVRLGDGLDLRWVLADPQLRADDCDVAHICHTAIHVVAVRDGAADHYRDVWAPAAVEVRGVSGVLGLESRYQEGGVQMLVHLLDGDPAEVVPALRSVTAHPPGVEIVVDGPWQLISPLQYPWADGIRESWLPATVAG